MAWSYIHTSCIMYVFFFFYASTLQQPLLFKKQYPILIKKSLKGKCNSQLNPYLKIMPVTEAVTYCLRSFYTFRIRVAQTESKSNGFPLK